MAKGDADSTRGRAIIIWSVLLGGVFGSAVGYFLSVDRDLPLGLSILIAGGLIATLCYLGTSAVVSLGAAPARMLFPSGDGVVGPPAYLSRAQAFSVRHQYDEARAIFEEALRLDPADHVASLALADLHAGPLRDPEASRTFLKRALASGRLDPGAEAFQMRRLAESLLDSPKPSLAAPHLAQLAERFNGSPHGVWAQKTLQELKRSLD